ncbi:uncharacterized protein LOC110359654 isoform X4 [Columba livia]|uniref:uncharacterized protein LOC110359654 isoform X4 n=1 Tax=Columba livia TaxID=8932 RepID=UPI0031BA45B1
MHFHWEHQFDTQGSAWKLEAAQRDLGPGSGRTSTRGHQTHESATRNPPCLAGGGTRRDYAFSSDASKQILQLLGKRWQLQVSTASLGWS